MQLATAFTDHLKPSALDSLFQATLSNISAISEIGESNDTTGQNTDRSLLATYRYLDPSTFVQSLGRALCKIGKDRRNRVARTVVLHMRLTKINGATSTFWRTGTVLEYRIGTPHLRNHILHCGWRLYRFGLLLRLPCDSDRPLSRETCAICS
jgi:hypothetical protein